MTISDKQDPDGIRARKGWMARYAELDEGVPAWQEGASPALIEMYPALLTRALKEASDPVHTINVVDLGCGDGRNLLYILQASATVREFRVKGLDVSPIALARSQSLLAEYDERRFSLELADIMTDRVAEDHTVDILCCIDVFGQLPVHSVGGALRAWGRVLARGGQLLLNAYTPEDDTRLHCERDGSAAGNDAYAYWYKDTYYKYYTLAEVVALIETAGLTPTIVERMKWRDPPHGSYRPEPHTHVSWVILSTAV